MAWLKLLTLVMVGMVGRVTTQIPSMEMLGQWMRIAARAGDAVYIQRLIDYGVPVDLQDPNGFTSLMWAAYFGRLDCVTLLLENGANPDHQNIKDDTSLMWASLGGFYDVVVELIEHGADPNLKENEGWTALMGAAVQGHYDIAEFLVDSGADKETENVLGHAAITLAAAMDNSDIVELLADFSHIDHQDKKEMTPLHHAAASNYTITLKKVLEYCPNYTLVDVNNKTAMDRAKDIGFAQGIKILNDYIHASCSRFGESHEVGDVIYQNCEALVCHCTGRWRLTGIRDPQCGKRKNIILTRQRQKEAPPALADDC